MDILHKLASLLLEKETIMGPDLDRLIFSMRDDGLLPSHLREARKSGAPPVPDGPEAAPAAVDGTAAAPPEPEASA